MSDSAIDSLAAAVPLALLAIGLVIIKRRQREGRPLPALKFWSVVRVLLALVIGWLLVCGLIILIFR
jgi:hypothetical protein